MYKILFTVIIFLAHIGPCYCQGKQPWNRNVFSPDPDYYTKFQIGMISNNNGLGWKMFKGFSLSSTYNYRISPILPLYLEAGLEFADLKYSGGSLDKIDGEYIGSIGAENEAKWIYLSVPMNVNYIFPINENISVSPYLGTILRFNIVADGKYIDSEGSYSYSFLDYDEMGDDKWCNTQLVGNIGMNVFYYRYFVGYNFQWDYIGITKCSKTKIHGITAGIVF